MMENYKRRSKGGLIVVQEDVIWDVAEQVRREILVVFKLVLVVFILVLYFALEPFQIVGVSMNSSKLIQCGTTILLLGTLLSKISIK